MLSTSATSASCRKRRPGRAGSLDSVMTVSMAAAAGRPDHCLWTTGGGETAGPPGCRIDRAPIGAPVREPRRGSVTVTDLPSPKASRLPRARWLDTRLLLGVLLVLLAVVLGAKVLADVDERVEVWSVTR